MRKRLISLLLCFVMCTALLPVSAQAVETATPPAPEIPSEGDVWDGSITKPTKLVQKDGVYYYEITKCAELAYVAQTGGDWLGYNYILGDNLIFNDVVITCDDNGACTNTEQLKYWRPIATPYGTYFTGCFDGGGYVISGLYNENSYGSISEYGGLFASCNNAVLKNITIVNSYVSTVLSGREAGGLVAYCSYSTVENCHFIGYVASAKGEAGGLIGSLVRSQIKNCSAAGRVFGFTAAGGLIAQGNGGSVSKCVSRAVVNGETKVGGLIGEDWNLLLTVSDCVAFGDVIGTESVGGFIGYAYNIDISNSCSFGDVVATAGTAGGFAGKTEEDYSSIVNCFSAGNISATSYAGGFVGSWPADISCCYSVGTVTSIDSAGGFMGEDRRIWGETLSIESCYYIKDNNYNEELFGTGVATSDIIGEIEGKSRAYLKEQSTFVGWDFDEIWSISTNKNGGYPYLQWQESTLSDIKVSSVQLSETSLSLAVGDHAYLTATVSPTNASNQSITWSSADSDIADVSAAGKVTAISSGTATITAATKDGGYTATCIVSVTERMPEEYKINSITVRDNNGTALSTIPSGSCLATVSITNLASEGNSLVFLASYTSTGQYQGMMWVSVEDLPVGATIKVSLPVDNATGEIKNLKAFTAASFSNLTPLGAAVSFFP